MVALEIAEEFQSINSYTAIDEVEQLALNYFTTILNRKVKSLKANSWFALAFTWQPTITGRVIAISCIIDQHCYSHRYIKVSIIGILDQVSLLCLLISP